MLDLPCCRFLNLGTVSIWGWVNSLWETVMCIVQPLLNRCRWHPFNHNNKKCFQKLANITWGTQSSPVKNHCQKSTKLVLSPRTINYYSSQAWLYKSYTNWSDISELSPCITYFVLLGQNILSLLEFFFTFVLLQHSGINKTRV